MFQMDMIFNTVIVRLPFVRMEIVLDRGKETYQQDHAAIQMWAANHIEILEEHDFAGIGRIAATQFPRVMTVTVTDPESGCGVVVHPEPV
jgi:hypothetical protein